MLRRRSPQAILDALTSGWMKYQGLALSGEERRAIAEQLTGRALREPLVRSPMGTCAAAVRRGAPVDPRAGPAWNGWGNTAGNTHFQSAEQAGLTAEQVPRLHLKWAFGFPDATSAWAQPTIAGGRLFVGSQNGMVYSLDAASGCVVWTFAAQGGVRSSISIGPGLRSRRSSSGPGSSFGEAGGVAYFSDQKGFVYAVDAAGGKQIWTRKVDDHPLVRLTGSPVFSEDRLYVPTSSYEEGGKPPAMPAAPFAARSSRSTRRPAT